MSATRVHLFQIGAFLPDSVHLTRLAKKLNALQPVFEFVAHAEQSDIVKVDCTVDESTSCRYADDELFPHLAAVADAAHVPSGELCVGITALRITKRDDSDLDGTEDWLTLWQNDLCRLGKEYARFGIISVALWEQIYQSRAYRSSAQYVACMLVVFFGDRLYKESLTHRDFRWCVFDFNDDLDSVVESVKKANIHEGVRVRIRQGVRNPDLSVDATNDAILDAMMRVLRWVRRPTAGMILQSYEEGAVMPLFISGFVLTFISETIKSLLAEKLPDGSNINHLPLATIALVIMLAGLMFYQHYRPSGKLR